MLVFIFRNVLFVVYFIFLLNAHNFKNHVRAKNVKLPTPILHVNQTDSSAKKQSTEKHPTCVTSGCIKTASNIRKYLDESVDPCDNFYEFACGNFRRNTMIPEGKGSIDLFSIVEDLVGEQLRTIISGSSELNESRPFQLAKNFHSSCLNETIIEKRGLKPFHDILKEFGGWPVLKGDSWLSDDFDWVEIVKIFRRKGFSTRAIFSLSVETDTKNSTKRVLIVSYTDNSLG